MGLILIRIWPNLWYIANFNAKMALKKKKKKREKIIKASRKKSQTLKIGPKGLTCVVNGGGYVFNNC
jgi:hypothetical protein